MFGSDRTQIRRMFIGAWKKHRERAPMEPLEKMIAAVIEQHPEYHRHLESPETLLDKEFTPEGGQTNPFLHMGMHISLQEQISTDQPAGIGALYRRLTIKTGDPHESEHRMMECLGQILWEAQRANRLPDERAYLECLNACLR